MATKRKNPAAPVLLLTVATVAAVGVGSAVYAMPQSKPKRRKKSMPPLVGGLRDSGVEFRHVDEPDKLQADFLLVTSASEAEWASKVAEWMYAKLNQPEIDIHVWPGADDLRVALSEAWDVQVSSGTKKSPSALAFIESDVTDVDGELSENPAWPWVVGGVAAVGLSQAMCRVVEKASGRVYGRQVRTEMYGPYGVSLHRTRRVCDPWKNFHVRVYGPHPSVGFEDGSPVPMELRDKEKSFPTMSAAMVYFNEESEIAHGMYRQGSLQ